MAGCSLTLCWLDGELEPLWRPPAHAFVMKGGVSAAAQAATPSTPEDETVDDVVAMGTPEGQAAGGCVAFVDEVGVGATAAVLMALVGLLRRDVIAGSSMLHGDDTPVGIVTLSQYNRL